jgi:hypothetical protein
MANRAGVNGYGGAAYLNKSDQLIGCTISSGGFLAHNAPLTFQAGDELDITITYEAAVEPFFL